LMQARCSYIAVEVHAGETDWLGYILSESDFDRLVRSPSGFVRPKARS